MDTPETTPQDQQETPATPQAGGSYLQDPQTGELTLVHRTRDSDEQQPDPAQE